MILYEYLVSIKSMNIHPIATIHTPFSEKFTIPRQAQIVNEARGVLHFADEYRTLESLDGLAAHSHYWLIWGFHLNEHKEKKLSVRPPRLGGNTKVGVFATRSPFRPNNLGLSVVKLESINTDDFSLVFSGVDMLTDSPIYDLKPYVPYADSRIDARSEWAGEPPQQKLTVYFETVAEQAIRAYDQATNLPLFNLVFALLSYDPRPAYKANKIDDKVYATKLYDMDIAWQITDDTVTVISAIQK